jgi:hypothetical protein
VCLLLQYRNLSAASSKLVPDVNQYQDYLEQNKRTLLRITRATFSRDSSGWRRGRRGGGRAGTAPQAAATVGNGGAVIDADTPSTRSATKAGSDEHSGREARAQRRSARARGSTPTVFSFSLQSWKPHPCLPRPLPVHHCMEIEQTVLPCHCFSGGSFA